jgi:xanthine/CO dehydrogenase XdhC/CoxF family maturation factor
VQPPPPRLWIVGAVHIAAALVTFAKALGFRTIVIDPRTAFATPVRFSHADELIVRWPQEVLTAANLDAAACVVVLTHDAKIDNPALAAALRSPARYIGALGARKTHAARIAALRAGAGRCPACPHPRTYRPRHRRAAAGGDRAGDHGGDRGGGEWAQEWTRGFTIHA